MLLNDLPHEVPEVVRGQGLKLDRVGGVPMLGRGLGRQVPLLDHLGGDGRPLERDIDVVASEVAQVFLDVAVDVGSGLVMVAEVVEVRRLAGSGDDLGGPKR